MAFNWFKKQEEANQKAKAPVVKVAKKEKVKPVTVEPIVSESQPTASKKNHNAFKILLHPIVTEKTTYLEGDSQYCFEVSPRANKIEIRKASVSSRRCPAYSGRYFQSQKMVWLPAKSKF